MFHKAAMLGQLFDRIDKPFVNRTGSTLNKGSIAAVDLTGSDGDVQAFTAWNPASHADTAHPLANVISVGAAHDDGWILGVLLEDSLANDAVGLFRLFGICDVLLADNGAIASGARIRPTSGQVYASAESDGLAVAGIALEAGPAGATGAALGKCIWGGGLCWLGAQAEV